MHLVQEKNERVPDGVKVTQSGQILTINNVEKSDEGQYFCEAQSTELTIEKISTFTLKTTQGNMFICNKLI